MWTGNRRQEARLGSAGLAPEYRQAGSSRFRVGPGSLDINNGPKCAARQLVLSSRKPHDNATALRNNGQGPALDYRCAPCRPIRDRVVDAGCARRASRRADDLAHLDRFSYSYADRRALSVAGDPSSSARKFASAMAADHVRGRALVALCSGLADHDERLAFRLCTRLACLMVLRRAPPNADLRKPSTGQGARRLASEFHVGLISRSRTTRRGSPHTSAVLSRWRHAPHVAWPACDGSACQSSRSKHRAIGHIGLR